MKNLRELALVFLFVFCFSYLLNFVWESFHAVFLYEEHNISSKRYVLMMNYVSSVDGLLIMGVYLLVSLFWKNLLWLRDMGGKQALVAVILGLAIAVFIEYMNVNIRGIWSYKESMPTIFGIGLSPLVQLSATAVLAFLLTKTIVYGRGILSVSRKPVRGKNRCGKPSI